MRAIVRYTVLIELASPDDYPPEVTSWKEAAEFEEKLIMVAVEHGTDKEIELDVKLESIDLVASEGEQEPFDVESEPFVRSKNPNLGMPDREV